MDLAKMLPTVLLGPIAHFGGFITNVRPSFLL